MSELEDRRDELYRRLETGYERIETALTEGKDITDWEALWHQLLQDYEKVCDELAAAPAEQRALFDTSRRAETGGR